MKKINNITLAGCATAGTTMKTAEATDQTTGRYLFEIDRSNDQSSHWSNFAVERFYNFAHYTSNARMTFLSFRWLVFLISWQRNDR